MGIHYHLKSLTCIGDTERFEAVAQTEVGDLYLYRNTTKLDLLVTPVKLESIARVILKRDERFDQCCAVSFPPGDDIAPNSVVATSITFTLKLLE